MGSDLSGHLGLHFRKGAWHCVRCGAGGRNLAEFLERNGIDAALARVGHTSVSEVVRAVRSLRREVRYQPPELDRAALPRMRRMVEEDFTAPTVYGTSMAGKGVAWSEASDYALCCGLGRMSEYVVFPFFESLEDETPVYWQGRDATGKAFLRKKNPSAEECPQGKNHWLYGFEFAERGCEAYLVEGSLDAISLQTWLARHRGRGHTALGIQGTAFSFPGPGVHPLNSQYGKLASLKPARVHVVLDSDAWQKSTELASVLRLCGLDASAVRLRHGDPNEEVRAGTLDLGGAASGSLAAAVAAVAKARC